LLNLIHYKIYFKISNYLLYMTPNSSHNCWW